jgi:hypothetical protein
MSNAVITSEFYEGTINISSNGANGDIFMGRYRGAYTFLCSGEMKIDAPLNSINVFLSSVSLQGVWSENFLMGFAGLICGSFLSYVFVKYAV